MIRYPAPLPDGLLGDAAWFSRQVDAHAALLHDLPKNEQRRMAVRYALELDTRPILKPHPKIWVCKMCLYVSAMAVRACPMCGEPKR